MKRRIIISGRECSGKSWIALAIASTHKDAIIVNAAYAHGMAKQLQNNHSVVIIEGCSRFTILELSELFDKDYPVVFTTNTQMTEKEMGKDFHVINCNNQML